MRMLLLDHGLCLRCARLGCMLLLLGSSIVFLHTTHFQQSDLSIDLHDPPLTVYCWTTTCTCVSASTS